MTDDTEVIQSGDPEEAFGTLSDPTRIAILRALWGFEDHEAGFAELRKAVGMRDSGKFNYHIGQFEGRFVEVTDDGYALTRAGVQLVGALFAGTYTEGGDVGPVPADERCPMCGGDLEFRYERETARIDCENCGTASEFPVPPGVFAGYDPDALPAVAEQYAWSEVERVARGFCRFCDGRVETWLATAAETAGPETDPPDPLEDIPMVRDRCQRCDHTMATNLGMRLVSHPAVVAFFYDHGTDYRELPLWRLAMAENMTVLNDRDPLGAEVTYTAGEESLTLTVEDPVRVVDVERRTE